MEDHGEITSGTVGWEGDTQDDIVDLGNDADGHTLVHVTLHEGRDRSKAPPDSAIATGRQVSASVSAPSFHVPKLHSVVWLARLAGSNAYAIIHNPTPNTTDQFTGPDRSLTDVGDDTDMILRGRSITLQAATGEWIGIGPRTGIQIGDAGGHGAQLRNGQWMFWIADGGDAKTVLKLTKDIAIAQNKNGAGFVSAMSVGDGKFKVLGNSAAIATGNVALGVLASPACSVHYGPPGIGISSTTVFTQP